MFLSFNAIEKQMTVCHNGINEYKKSEKQHSKLSVQTTARHAIHLQYDISTNALDIRTLQSPNCLV
jgi:hypothetical protein